MIRPSFNAALLLGMFAFVIDALRAELPPNGDAKPVKLFEVPSYCEGVVFDAEGRGYTSHGDTITRFSLDGTANPWAVTGAPNGHKILRDGTHLVCDASRHAVLRLNADGAMLDPASKECDGKPLRGPNDLTLDAPNGGIYFTDPGESGLQNLIGTVHYVNRDGKTSLVADGLAFPNGIVLVGERNELLVAESQKNRILAYPVLAPGVVGPYRVFCELPAKGDGQHDNQPDGICLDAEGNLYVAHFGMRQVQVLDRTGQVIRRYAGGNLLTSNVAFGGPANNQLFVTGSIEATGVGAVFRLDLNQPGRRVLPELRP